MIGLAFGALSTLGTVGQFAGNLMGAFGRRAQNQDALRALQLQKAQTVGLAAAKSGASGVEMTSGSTMDYLAGLGAEFDRAIKTQQQVTRSSFIADLFGAGGGVVGGASNTMLGLKQLGW